MKRLIASLGGAVVMTALALVVITATVGVATAASVHLSRSRITFTDNADLTLSATGRLTGLGNELIKVTVSAVGTPTSACTNPSGQNQPAGHNPAPGTYEGSQLINPGSFDKNGNYTFTVSTVAPASPVAGAPDCPNSKWTQTITDIAFTSATITVEQPVGTVVLTANCTFAATTNGSTRTVACTAS